jgi:hypothetical protein
MSHRFFNQFLLHWLCTRAIFRFTQSFHIQIGRSSEFYVLFNVCVQRDSRAAPNASMAMHMAISRYLLTTYKPVEDVRSCPAVKYHV